MSYERVNLEARTVAGYSARTSNSDPKMGEIIGGLWQRLFQSPPAPRLDDGETYGVYSHYENGTEGCYTVTAALPVPKDCALPPEATLHKLPAGPYAVFSAPGGPEAAAALWQEVWAAPLERAFTYDFEEYSTDGKGGRLRIYIALRT